MAFSGRLLTGAIADLLETNGLTVYVGVKDDTDPGGWTGAEGASTYEPYTVIFPVTGGYFEGPICQPNADGRPDYIITSFGSTSAQAQWGDDRVHEILTTSKPTIAGRVVQSLICDVHGGVVRDDDVTPPVFSSPSRWRVFETAV